MLVRSIHQRLGQIAPPYKKCTASVHNFLKRKVTSKIPENLLRQIDKIVYLFEMALPFIVVTAVGLAGALTMNLPAIAVAGWIIPSALLTAYDMINNRDLYPWEYLENMNRQYKKKQVPESTPRPQLLWKTKLYLSQPQKNNVILVGPAGSGKTTLVNSLVQMLEGPDCPPELKDKTVLRLRIDKLNAGAKMGKLEARLLAVLNELVNNPKKYILFIDEVHQLIDDNGRTSLSNLLKPFLEKGLTCISATTDKEYLRIKEYDPGLSRRFHELRMPALTPQECLPMIQKKFSGQHIPEDTVQHAIQVALQISPDRALPDSAIDIIQNTVAYLKEVNQYSREIPVGRHQIDLAVRALDLKYTPVNPNDRKESLQLLTKLNAQVENIVKALREMHIIPGAQQERPAAQE